MDSTDHQNGVEKGVPSLMISPSRIVEPPIDGPASSHICMANNGSASVIPKKRKLNSTLDGPKSSSQLSSDIIIKIVSAEYGPCEGLRLQTGELTNDDKASIPVTRDVAPFLRALLIAGRRLEELQYEHHGMKMDDDDETSWKKTPRTIDENASNPREEEPNTVRVQSSLKMGIGGMAQLYIHLLGGQKSMNAVFGDPCPGISKKLYIHYIVTEASNDAKTRAAQTEVHHVRFAEHDPVVLRRRLTFFQDDAQLKKAVVRCTAKNMPVIPPQLRPVIPPQLRLVDDDPVANDDDQDHFTLERARSMGRSQSIAEFTEETMSLDSLRISQSNDSHASASFQDASRPIQDSPRSSNNKQWRLRSAVSEIVLPIVLPFLQVRERVQCRLICRSWKHVVRDWGVATTIDSNDPTIPNFTRPFLRGIVSHSHSSLHSLFLSGFEELDKSDLHPAIPQLRKLRTLDVTRCHALDDSTLQLLAEHVHRTLEVLYIKGLRRVTDRGILAICDSCSKLEVLDISNVPITDIGGMAIQNLTRLRALFTRDNYQLTNQSIDVITEKCRRLQQLTLWGCTRLKHLLFHDVPTTLNSGKLVFLNLWGCYNLNDDVAQALGCMKHLKSLIVSECHRLTDRFVVCAP